MSNAIQYSDASSPITVTILGKDPKTVNVNVHNFGTPISARNQKIIFQSWMRGQVLEERTHLGLGLYVTKLIVESHGGEIAVTSDEKSGTTFTVQLPRRQSS
jgi:signal transduction histidine kinase